MKKHKLLSLVFAAVLLLSLLTGCGASAGDSAYFENSKAEMPEAAAPMEDVYMEEGSVGTGNTPINLPANRKLIRTVHLDAQTQDMDTLLPNLEQLIASLDGYIENREVYSNSSYDSQWRNAHLTVRIPSDKADIFLGQVEDAANVTSINENLEDVTLDYVATESRIKALEAEQARLLELMEQAESLTDLLEIEARLTDVVAQLETVASQLRLYDNLIDYTTIHLSVHQVTKLTTPEDEMTVWQRIATGFKDNLEGLGDALVDIFVWLIVSSPVLVVIAICVTGLILLARLGRKKRIAKKAARKAAKAQADQDNPQ